MNEEMKAHRVTVCAASKIAANLPQIAVHAHIFCQFDHSAEHNRVHCSGFVLLSQWEHLQSPVNKVHVRIVLGIQITAAKNEE